MTESETLTIELIRRNRALKRSRRLLEALETYRQEASKVVDIACTNQHDRRPCQCQWQMPKRGNWLPVEVEAERLQRALGELDSAEVRSS